MHRNKRSTKNPGSNLTTTVAAIVTVILLTGSILALASVLGNREASYASRGEQTETDPVLRTDAVITDAAPPSSESDMSETNLVMVQNFIDAMYCSDPQNLSEQEFAQFKPLIEQSFASLRNIPEAAGALETIEELATNPTNATIDLIDKPTIERIGDNGISVTVRGTLQSDGSGDMSFEDVWNLVMSETGEISSAQVNRTEG